MEEQEDLTERLHESINEVAEERKSQRWTLYVAISTALIAVFAAIVSMMAGHHSDEALIAQIKASDQWNYYQAKGIKAEIAGHNADTARSAKEQRDQAKIKVLAQDYEKNSEQHLAKHSGLAKSVTLFQVAIAISAISVLTARRRLWYASLIIAASGIVFFLLNLLLPA